MEERAPLETSALNPKEGVLSADPNRPQADSLPLEILLSLPKFAGRKTTFPLGVY